MSNMFSTLAMEVLLTFIIDLHLGLGNLRMDTSPGPSVSGSLVTFRHLY